MHASLNNEKPQPRLPAPFSLPLKILPGFVHNRVLVTTLNRLFAEQLDAGELDFLQHKTLRISVEDAGIEYRLTLDNGRLTAADNTGDADLVIQGTLYNFLLLASRSEDSDTLFFSRRLHMQGDTELGLYVKNFLDGMDMESHKASATIESVLQKSVPVYERLFGGK